MGEANFNIKIRSSARRNGAAPIRQKVLRQGVKVKKSSAPVSRFFPFPHCWFADYTQTSRNNLLKIYSVQSLKLITLLNGVSISTKKVPRLLFKSQIKISSAACGADFPA